MRIRQVREGVAIVVDAVATSRVGELPGVVWMGASKVCHVDQPVVVVVDAVAALGRRARFVAVDRTGTSGISTVVDQAVVIVVEPVTALKVGKLVGVVAVCATRVVREVDGTVAVVVGAVRALRRGVDLASIARASATEVRAVVDQLVTVVVDAVTTSRLACFRVPQRIAKTTWVSKVNEAIFVVLAVRSTPNGLNGFVFESIVPPIGSLYHAWKMLS